MKLKRAVKNFPWIEVMLIVALAAALILKPQNQALSAAPDGTPRATPSVLPIGL